MSSGLAIWGPFIVIFGAALLVSVVQRYSRDICLLKFDAGHVLVQLKDGQWFWGRLEVHSKALEIVYTRPHRTAAGHELLTRIFYEQNFGDIALVLRPEPAPGSHAHEDWIIEMRRLRNPRLVRRAARNLRNLFHMLRNAFSESVALVIGVVKQRTAAGKIAGLDRHATDAGQKLLATIPASYEPILEHYLSREVAVETYKDPLNPALGVTERVGVLAEYSDKFLYLRDVMITEPFPGKALRAHDARDRFALLLPRSSSYVRHLARRPETPAPAAAIAPTPPQDGWTPRQTDETFASR
jgi:hypothetical protein